MRGQGDRRGGEERGEKTKRQEETRREERDQEREQRGETEGLLQTVCVKDIALSEKFADVFFLVDSGILCSCRRNRFNRSVVVSLRRSAVGEVLNALSEKFTDIFFLVDTLSEKFLVVDMLSEKFFLVDSGILCSCRRNRFNRSVVVSLRRSAVGEVLPALSEKFADIFFLVDTLSEKFADIFFLVDSGISAQEFQQVRTFLSRMVTQLNVGADAYRIGLAQYGSSVKVEFLLNAHQTKEQTSASLKRLRQRRLQAGEQRNLGQALDYARQNFFTSEAGSRAELGYRQYLVVLSGKESDDQIYIPSRRIKSSGMSSSSHVLLILV
ncbi:hypothetical protein WMY93_033070 [Mugilogobius chulae]|uniref:VWFA domain-containing protein n=1 Tax=Mugilogobius chulae TaxID=88201 RepID=A0AAW0MI54_9GOBI